MDNNIELRVQCLMIYGLVWYKCRQEGELSDQAIADLEEIDSFIKEAADSSGCLVELPFSFNHLKLGTKDDGVRHYTSKKELDKLIYTLYHDETVEPVDKVEYQKMWSESGAFEATPPRSRPLWEKFFDDLLPHLTSKSNKAKEVLLIFCYY